MGLEEAELAFQRQNAGQALRLPNILDDSEYSDTVHSKAEAPVSADTLRVNEEFARRFEHNRNRATSHRLNDRLESHGASASKLNTRNDGEDLSNEAPSESEDDEDDSAQLVSGILDHQINETLRAIKEKNPRVYDPSTRFYSEAGSRELATNTKSAEGENSLRLQEYQSNNLLKEREESPKPSITYVDEQDKIKQALINRINDDLHHGASNLQKSPAEEDDFLVKREKAAEYISNKSSDEISLLDIDRADRDPNAFLSKFMSTRAWVPKETSKLHFFESDNEEDEQRAEIFEQEYNLRFEDPQVSNKSIISHPRTNRDGHSVRKLDPTKRRKMREKEQLQRKEDRDRHQKDKSRLRRLRLKEITEKVDRIKDSAGLQDDELDLEEWAQFLAADWDEDRWEQQLQEKIGQVPTNKADYIQDDLSGNIHAVPKSEKPRWNSDVDIMDIARAQDEKANFTRIDPGSLDASAIRRPASIAKDQRKERTKLRNKVEQLVDDEVVVDTVPTDQRSKSRGSFRYRETTPETYGLTPLDILMASDSQLNDFSGLKKLATFRDRNRKRKDANRFGKKGRLKEWREKVFGADVANQRITKEHSVRNA